MFGLSVNSNLGAAAASGPHGQQLAVAIAAAMRAHLTRFSRTKRNGTEPMTIDAPPPDADNRLTRLELLLSHLQYDVDKLNEALIGQQSQIDALGQMLSKMETVIEHLPEPSRDLEQERPPHY